MNALTRGSARALVALVAAAVLATVASSPAGAGGRPRRTASVAAAKGHGAPAGAHLDYYGGRVLTHVKVDVVVWGSWSYPKSVPLTGKRSIASFFGGVTASPFLDWLSEYDTPTQHIGRGTLDGVYTVRPPSSADGKSIDGTQVSAALRTLIDAGRLPKPSTTRLYAIFFRSGQTIVTPDGTSTASFCAYHDTATYKSSTMYFAVVPYELGNPGCKAASTSFDSVTTIVSHELVEAITDPGVGLDRVSWYDQNYGEVADICAGPGASAKVTGGDGVQYAVQRAWSNRANDCIVSR